MSRSSSAVAATSVSAEGRTQESPASYGIQLDELPSDLSEEDMDIHMYSLKMFFRSMAYPRSRVMEIQRIVGNLVPAILVNIIMLAIRHIRIIAIRWQLSYKQRSINYTTLGYDR